MFEDFIKTLPKNLTGLFNLFKKYKFDMRIVGGAIRDLYVGQTPRDIDLATNAKPSEILYLLFSEIQKNENNLFNAKGIRHGTIVAEFDEGDSYEITSLGFSISISNYDTLIVESNDDWEMDAQRRDFTVNAMSLDLDGKVFDYLDGKKHIKNQEIVPIGKWEDRMANDPILMLRFIKLLAKFEKPKYDKRVKDVIRNNKQLIEVTPGTVWTMASILNQKYIDNALEFMQDIGIDPKQYKTEGLSVNSFEHYMREVNREWKKN